MFFEITAPVGALGLARDSFPAGTRVEFERTAPVVGDRRPTVVVSGDDPAEVAEAFRAAPTVAAFDHVGDADSASVYRLAWGETPPELVSRLRETGGAVLSGAAVAETWSFELRFPTEEAASRFYGGYDDATNPITLACASGFGLSQQADSGALTAKQKTAVVRALELGYFDVPRRATLDTLAAEFDISDTAASQRLRRGVANLLRASPHISRRPASADDA